MPLQTTPDDKVVGFFIDDLPSKSDQLDGLIDNYVDILFGGIKKSREPITIGIIGEWGSGKTTLMKLLQNKIDPPGKKKDAVQKCFRHSTFFHSWRYENHPRPLVPLLIQIISTIREFDETLNDKNEKFAETLHKVIRSICYSTSFDFGLVKIDSAKAIDSYKTGGTKKPDVPGIEEILNKYDDGYSKFIEIIENIMNQEKNEQVHQVVVFIDDLDRCGEQGLNVLDATKTLFDIPNIIFVIGLNPVLLEDWLKSKYGPGNFSTELYLEKIINVPVYVPSHNIPKQLTRKILRKKLGEILESSVPDDIKLAPHYFFKLQHEKYLTIRQLKRTLNRWLIIVNLNIFHKYIQKNCKDRENAQHNCKTEMALIVYDLILTHELFPECYKMLCHDGQDVLTKWKIDDEYHVLLEIINIDTIISIDTSDFKFLISIINNI